MVNLWKRRPRRLQLEIAVETLPGFSFLNTRSLLNFSIRPTLGGVPVSDGELQELLRSPGGLVRFKGEWVEADPGKIAALLKVWRAAAGRFRATGLSFADGVRLLAGVPAEARAGAPPLPGTRSRTLPGDGGRGAGTAALRSRFSGADSAAGTAGEFSRRAAPLPA